MDMFCELFQKNIKDIDLMSDELLDVDECDGDCKNCNNAINDYNIKSEKMLFTIVA
jgi:hypothetical protein